MVSSNCVFTLRMLISALLLLPLPSHAETQYNSVPSMKETVESLTAAAGVRVNLDACTSINKVGLRPVRMIMSYTCPVPESTRLQLRSEFLAHGWEPEKIVDGLCRSFESWTRRRHCIVSLKQPVATCALNTSPSETEI